MPEATHLRLHGRAMWRAGESLPHVCKSNLSHLRGFGCDISVGGRAKVAVSARKAERAAAAPLGLKMEEEPLLLRAARGEKVESTPVWMMRQAGRHMQCYRDLVKQYPTFRERSEIPEVSTEISLQPFEAYGVDGCILFSDILTPLPGMGKSRLCVFCLSARLMLAFPSLGKASMTRESKHDGEAKANMMPLLCTARSYLCSWKAEHRSMASSCPSIYPFICRECVCVCVHIMCVCGNI